MGRKEAPYVKETGKSAAYSRLRKVFGGVALAAAATTAAYMFLPEVREQANAISYGQSFLCVGGEMVEMPDGEMSESDRASASKLRFTLDCLAPASEDSSPSSVDLAEQQPIAEPVSLPNRVDSKNGDITWVKQDGSKKLWIVDIAPRDKTGVSKGAVKLGDHSFDLEYMDVRDRGAEIGGKDNPVSVRNLTMFRYDTKADEKTQSDYKLTNEIKQRFFAVHSSAVNDKALGSALINTLKNPGDTMKIGNQIYELTRMERAAKDKGPLVDVADKLAWNQSMIVTCDSNGPYVDHEAVYNKFFIIEPVFNDTVKDQYDRRNIEDVLKTTNSVFTDYQKAFPDQLPIIGEGADEGSFSRYAAYREKETGEPDRIIKFSANDARSSNDGGSIITMRREISGSDESGNELWSLKLTYIIKDKDGDNKATSGDPVLLLRASIKSRGTGVLRPSDDGFSSGLAGILSRISQAKQKA